ncbi:MAG: pilus motility taxis protein HmpF [Cyanobacteria bacterium P01_F01_bin.150]
MLYLAEVQKKTRTFGGSKAEFKLLACQRAEHSWSAVGEEVIPAPDDVPYNSGALVLVDLSGSRNVQRYTEAGKQLVGILQNFSRLQEKFKTQEEEIEQWKQSLTYQSQELNRREMEMEARQEQIQDVEADFEKLEQERQSIESLRQDVTQLQEDFNRKSQELEGAWAQLNGEKRRFEELQGDLAQSSGLDVEQANAIRQLLARLTSQIQADLPIAETVEQAQQLIQQQQQVMDGYWQNLEQRRQSAQQLQDEIDNGPGVVNWQHWHEMNEAWGKAQAGLASEQGRLESKKEVLATLTASLQQQEGLKDIIQQLATSDAPSESKVDIAALEQMPIGQLQSIVQDLKHDLEKNARFVSSQEEELTLQQQDIDALKQKIAAASEYDRLRLENELSDEQESYRMLNETLVGQRRNVQERKAILRGHEVVLAQRQGLPPPSDENGLNFSQVTSQVDRVQAQLTSEITALQNQIMELEQAIAVQESGLQQQAADVQQKRQELAQQDQALNEKKVAASELWGKVNTYQEVLQVAQDTLNGLRDKLGEMSGLVTQVQTGSEQQTQSVEELQNAVNALTADAEPQLATS